MKVIYPTARDPRYIQLVLLVSYVAYAHFASSFTRSPWQFVCALSGCVLTDLIILYLKKIPLVPVSGLITSMGIFLLANSPFFWPYALMAVLAILSKHLLRIDNRHIFNPNNFGLIIGLVFFSQDIGVEGANWGGHLWLAILIFGLGCYMVYRAKRVSLISSFILTFLALAFLRSYLNQLPLMTVLAPLSGASFNIFIFHMVSDPKTTPTARNRQIVFGIALGVLDGVFRAFEQKYAPFYSLFIMSGAYSSFSIFYDKNDEFRWNLKTSG